MRSLRLPLVVMANLAFVIGIGFFICNGVGRSSTHADDEVVVCPDEPGPGEAFVRSVISPTPADVAATRKRIAEQRSEFARAEEFLRNVIAETSPADLASVLQDRFVLDTDEWPCHMRDTIRVALMEVKGPETAWRLPAQIGWLDDEIAKRLVAEKPDRLSSSDELVAGLVFAGRISQALEAHERFAIAEDEPWRVASAALVSLGESGLAGASVDVHVDTIAKLRGALTNCTFDLSFESLLWRAFDDCRTDLERARVLAQIGAAIGGDSDHDPTTSRSVRANVAAAQFLADGSDREVLGSVLCAIATEYGSGDARRNRDDRVACALSAFASDECPDTSTWGVSTFRAGRYERLFGDPRRAIELQSRIFPSNVDDLEPGGNVMSAYQNYRHSAAVEISKCHEALRDFPAALDWLKRARDKYAYRSWCGTCQESERTWMAENLARLEELAGGGK